jgi:hypothetical protein
MGVTEDRILAVVECRKVEDVTLEHLEVLIGLGTAIKDGETRIEEAFPLAAAVSKPTFGKPEAKAPEKPAVAATPEPEASAPSANAADAAGESPQKALADALQGIPFDDFRDFMKVEGNAPGVNWEDVDGYETIPTSVALLIVKDAKMLTRCRKIYGSKEAK